MGIEIFFAGKKHFITSDRMQIIDLLFSTYETASQKNQELEAANQKLLEIQKKQEKDILERKRVEEELKQKQALLDKAKKEAEDANNAKGEFLANICFASFPFQKVCKYPGTSSRRYVVIYLGVYFRYQFLTSIS